MWPRCEEKMWWRVEGNGGEGEGKDRVLYLEFS